MDDKLIIEINEKTPIVDLVSEFVSLQKRGKNFMGLCPFHQEKTPSFSVSPEKNIAKCMSCGEGGTPINFYRKIKNISFDEAAQELAERAGITIKKTKVKKDPYAQYYELMNEVASFYQFNLKNSEKGQEALKYLYNRQMTDELILHFKMGYAPSYGDTLYQVLKDKNYAVSDMIKLGVVKQADDGSYYDLFSDRVIFPITNPKGDVVGLSGRTLNPKDQVKYINSPETVIFKKGLLLYHFYEALSEIRMSKQVILYEGFFDVISSYAAGVKNGIATMGTALTKDQAKLIKSVTQSIIIAYDGDQAGLKAADQGIPVLEKEGLKVEVLSIPEKMDPDEFINAYGPEKYEMLFGEYTQDSYAFRYQYYKRDKNLQDANDMKEFKKQVVQMIQSSDSSIQSFYIQKLSKELNIPVEELKVKPKLTTIVEPRIPKQEKPKILNRNERAERLVIFAMLKSKEICEYASKKLKPNDFADHITAAIRIRIENYYEDHLDLDINDFLDTLTKDQRDYVENILFKDMFWVDKIDVLEKNEIDKYIDLIKDASLWRRYTYLKDKIANLEDYNAALVEERDKIKRLLMNKK
ncbi:DNA primase [Peloplasma aerotolerans]|uniref:DNA primase n=1 Tax=Peloplasma aerotolerans TaxID=3044389 RepID=A0AAW6U7L8_9MOLU|nr:DNA primase [Mariniplasma sp. M4Ah]MDI6452609.1 DNA primase [Mariniplasma sp. M4Ah]